MDPPPLTEPLGTVNNGTDWYGCQVDDVEDREASPPSERSRRRGRPPEAERAQRRDAALDAALSLISTDGYERLTMAAIAGRAGSSKESLYAWFGSKEGLVGELIRRQSARTNAAVRAALDDGGGDANPRDVLLAIATGLLGLLLGEASLALNRAAMSSPSLASVLLEHGRHTTGPLVERYLARLHADGVLVAADSAAAFSLFYGLVVQDAQIRALLGEPSPSLGNQRRAAETAVDRFLALSRIRPGRAVGTGVGASGPPPP
jgi:AcrR family transcriptional regulator